MDEIQKMIQDHILKSPNVDSLIDSAKSLIDSNNKEKIHAFLELGHLPIVNEAIYEAKKVDEWFKTIHKLIIQSNYDVAVLLKQRSKKYGDKALFQSILNDKIVNHSYNYVWKTVQSIGTYFTNHINPHETVGIFSPNQLNGVLIDLACLTYGIRVVPIPINLSLDHLGYVLKHAEITHLFLGSEKALKMIQEIKFSGSSILINNQNEWNDFLSACNKQKTVEPQNQSLKSIASIMYTSGTTDNPKGIIFTQENIITKRFARALALPKIGADDSFLCYLPLYHTFGRWFEMMGSIFWGSTYAFT